MIRAASEVRVSVSRRSSDNPCHLGMSDRFRPIGAIVAAVVVMFVSALLAYGRAVHQTWRPMANGALNPLAVSVTSSMSCWPPSR